MERIRRRRWPQAGCGHVVVAGADADACTMALRPAAERLKRLNWATDLSGKPEIRKASLKGVHYRFANAERTKKPRQAGLNTVFLKCFRLCGRRKWDVHFHIHTQGFKRTHERLNICFMVKFEYSIDLFAMR